MEFKKGLFGGVKEKEVAQNPNQWLTGLLHRNVSGLRLSHAPRNDPQLQDRMSSAFVGGGGVWAIEAVKPDGYSEFWRARWEVGNRSAPDRRIWRIAYGKVAETKTPKAATKPLTALKVNLQTTLQEIHDFSQKHECGGFTQRFSNALESLSKSAPKHGYHKDLSVDGMLSPDALALLDSCQTTWVFGGMGSWNDMVFDGDDGREYDRVSENLFRTLSEIIPAAANDSFKAV